MAKTTTVSSRENDDWVKFIDSIQTSFNHKFRLSLRRGNVVSMCIHRAAPEIAQELGIDIPKSILKELKG